MRINFKPEMGNLYLDEVIHVAPAEHHFEFNGVRNAIVEAECTKLSNWEPGMPYHRAYGPNSLYNKWLASLPNDKRQIETRQVLARDETFESALADQFLKVLHTQFGCDLRFPYYEGRQKMAVNLLNISDDYLPEDCRVDEQGQELLQPALHKASLEAITADPKTVAFVSHSMGFSDLKGWTQRLAVASGGLGCDLPLIWHHVTQEVLAKSGQKAHNIDKVFVAANDSIKILGILEKTVGYITGIQKVCEEKWMTAAKQVAAQTGQLSPAFTPWPVVEHIVRKATTDLVLK